MGKINDDSIAIMFCHPVTKDEIIKRAEKAGSTIPPDTAFVLVPSLEVGTVIVGEGVEFANWLTSPAHDIWTTKDEEEEENG